jgi:hypothetical protein
MNVAVEEPTTTAPATEIDSDSEPEEGSWLVLLSDEDTTQVVVPHPEGKSKKEVIDAFLKSRRIARGGGKRETDFFALGSVVIDPLSVRSFGWADDFSFPAIDAFDSIQEKVEELCDSIAELVQAQGVLQDLQTQILEEELEEADPHTITVAAGGTPKTAAPTAATAKKPRPPAT